MRKLLIVHPGTETIISLSDDVFIVDATSFPDDVREGAIVNYANLYGIRIDNYNMSHFLFGES